MMFSIEIGNNPSCPQMLAYKPAGSVNQLKRRSRNCFILWRFPRFNESSFRNELWWRDNSLSQYVHNTLVLNKLPHLYTPVCGSASLTAVQGRVMWSTHRRWRRSIAVRFFVRWGWQLLALLQPSRPAKFVCEISSLEMQTSNTKLEKHSTFVAVLLPEYWVQPRWRRTDTFYRLPTCQAHKTLLWTG